MKPNKIKETKETKEKYEITPKSFKMLVRTIFQSIRSDLNKLYYLKQITQKERSYLGFEFDKIIYRIKD